MCIRDSTNTGGRVKSEVKYNPGKPTPSSQIRKVKPKVQIGKAEPVEAGATATQTSTTPIKKMGNIEKQNRARMGDARVDALKAKNAKFQAAKKSGNLAQFRKDNPKMSGADRAKQMAKERLAKKAAMANEEFTPYDIVLEYLLSSEQAATIEEANYVMTEMDGKTINDIVEMQGQINRADIIGGTQAAKNAAAGKGKYTPGKGVTKDFKLDPAFQLPKA